MSKIITDEFIKKDLMGTNHVLTLKKWRAWYIVLHCMVPGVGKRRVNMTIVVGTLSPKHNFKGALLRHSTLNSIYETTNSEQDKTKNF